jgi:hypothetical protein
MDFKTRLKTRVNPGLTGNAATVAMGRVGSAAAPDFAAGLDFAA